MAPSNDVPKQPSRKIIWIAGGIVILILIVASLWGIGLGTGGALGVSGAAPSGDNATPSPSATAGLQPQGTEP
ncbi:MAG: hypothetical protein ACTHLU_06590 [Novosphingobium sp.]